MEQEQPWKSNQMKTPQDIQNDLETDKWNRRTLLLKKVVPRVNLFMSNSSPSGKEGIWDETGQDLEDYETERIVLRELKDSFY